MARMLLSAKFEHLQRLLAAHPGALTAYSGGADSAFLAEVSHRVHGDSALAVTADSPSIPRKELKAATTLAYERGWRHEVVSTNELEDERYASNPTDRCYWCKTALFDVVVPMAAGRGVPVLLGTN
ncbi:MAG: ATP-dependent sacrificial sulfur transferase LarE, partial [Acidimicrobiia bacterium]